MFDKEIAELEDDLANIKRMIETQVKKWEGADTADGRAMSEEILYTTYDDSGRCSLESLMLMKSNVALALAMYKIRQPKKPEARMCGHQNLDPSYPYMCTKPIGHRDSEDPRTKRHGYAGIFWT